MEAPAANIGIRKYNGHWQDFIDRELNSMDHLIQNSFAEFRKEVKGSKGGVPASGIRIRRASEDDGAILGQGPSGIKVPVPNVSTLPRRLTSSQKAVPQEPPAIFSKMDGLLLRESTYVPPGIKELESLYAPMKNLNLPLSLGADMPKPHPLPFSAANNASDDEKDELETICSVMEDIPPLPPPVQSHALLKEGLGHDLSLSKSPLNPRRLFGDWGSSSKTSRCIAPPAPPKRTNSKLSLRRPAYLNLSRDSSSLTFPKPNHHRTSLMSTGSSESSGSSSLSSETARVLTPTTSHKDEPFFFRAVTSSPQGDYETIHPCRLDSSMDTTLKSSEEEDYVKMHPVFTSRDNFHRTTHYINLLYNAVSGGSLDHPQYLSMMSGGRRSGSEELVSHVYEEPEKCKTDSALRARKKRAKAMAEYRELMAEVETKRRYRIGLNLFNQSPMTGIEYLSQSFLELSPPSVAKFLHDCSGLSKHKVGEYITELSNAFCMKVLGCFMDKFDFSKLRMDKAVRQVLELVHIPGDASRIRKILEVFSKRYIKCNPKFCAEDPAPTDAVIAFSYAVLLLMTDAADAQKKKKMTLGDFSERLSRFRIDPKLVKSVYKGVKKEEFRDGGDHFYQTLVLQERILEPNSRKTARIASHSRRLVCICQMYEVHDILAKKDPDQSSRKRDIFLFNDLLIVTRQSYKFGKKTSLIYKDSFPLLGLELSLFHTSVYGFGVQICKKGERDSALLTLNADSEMDRYKFVMDLQESILEANQTEEALAKLSEQ